VLEDPREFCAVFPRKFNMPPKAAKKRVPLKPGASKKKSDPKELARKEKEAKERERQALVRAAELSGKDIKDVFAFASPLLGKYTHEGVDFDVEFSHPRAMEEATMDWCLGLVRRNMKDQYIAARWGWSDGEKRKELENDHARFLLVRLKTASAAPADATAAASSSSSSTAATDEFVSDSKGELQAFVHFRFMLEGDAPVLYVYEIQCEPRVRGKGIGTHLMKALELVAYQEKMHYVLLTVFNSNAGARRFYARLGYTLDELSKSAAMLQSQPTYRILSKCVDPEVKAAKGVRHSALKGKIDIDGIEAALADEAEPVAAATAGAITE
jgi:N-alpha-acetyltransferase 40